MKANLLANGVRQAFKQPAVFGQSPNDRGHVAFDASETLGVFASRLSPNTVVLRNMAIRLGHAADKLGLIMNKQRHGFVEPIVAVLVCAFLCQGRLR
ncbi:MAG TPA: hypothetical protein VFW87_24060 [Pirellulales bacterium]|nr:hypothetical protein [Pirellulales bacterium]